MSERRDKNPGSHRLFHAIVMMGGSMAFGCGGNVSGDEGTTGAGGSGGGEPPGPGGASGGGGLGGFGPEGAAGASGAGGTLSGGGAGGGDIPVMSGGFAGFGGASGAGGTTGDIRPFPCPPGQWDCSANPPGCTGSGDGYRMPAGCKCDDARPVRPEDCGEGQAMVCRRGIVAADGTPLADPVPFECRCVEDPGQCELGCDNVYEDYDLLCAEEIRRAQTVQYLCGCAVIVLR